MKYLLTFVVLSFYTFAFSQEDILPEKINNAFKSKYASQVIESWNFNNDLYSIEFTKKGSTCASVFDIEGNWIETSEIISDDDIPATVVKYIKTNYPDWKVSYTEMVLTANAKKNIRVNIYNNDKSQFVKSDANGLNIVVSDSQF